MSAGLQVWDASGNLIFDQSTTVVKVLGTASVGSSYTGSTQSGTLSDPNIAAYAGHPLFVARIDGGFSTEGWDATFTVGSSSISWSYPTANYPDQTVIYGIR